MKKNSLTPKILILFVFVSISAFNTEKTYGQIAKQEEIIDSSQDYSEKINDIKIARYTYTENTATTVSDTIPAEVGKPDAVHSQIGLVATDLEKVFPETVHIDAQKNKNVDYYALIPIMFRIIQEQNKKIAQLQSKVNQLEN